MMLLQTVVAFLFALGILVTIHELGHYWVARWCGVKILRFSVGMGKVIYSRKFGPDQTEWALSMLPLGGYVKMLDAREQGSESMSAADRAREFTAQTVWKRMAIVAAGPLANFILASILFAALYIHGIPEPSTRIRVPTADSLAYQAGLRQGDLILQANGQTVHTWSELRLQMVQAGIEKKSVDLVVRRPDTDGESHQFDLNLPLQTLSQADWEADFPVKLGFSFAAPPAVLAKVLPGGVAEKAGLQAGDQILAVNGQAILDGLHLVQTINNGVNYRLHLTVKRAAQELTFDLTPEAVKVEGQPIGRIQIQLNANPEIILQASDPLRGLLKGVQKTVDTSWFTLKTMGKMLTGHVSWKSISGPLTIADYAGQTARASWLSYVNFIALISISLGVMNLLPIPVLDGGHLLYYSLEVLMGKPVPEQYGYITQRIGVVLLVCLMVVAFFNDLVRLMS